MHTRSTLTQAQREQLVNLFEQGMGAKKAARFMNLAFLPCETLYKRWLVRGRMCLMHKTTKPSYSFEFKKEIVQRYIAGETGQALAIEYNLSSSKVLQTWARKWRIYGDEGLKPQPKGRPVGSTYAKKPVTEIEQLERTIARLEAENAYLKKLRDLMDQGYR